MVTRPLVDPETIHLHSARLDVEISQPSDAYHGTRFDWNRFISQETLDGPSGHTFCVLESYTPGKGKGGIGLRGEFGIDQPLGFNTARPDELFPKLGIGLLRRSGEKPYGFFRTYEIAQFFPVEVESGSDWASFSIEPVECRPPVYNNPC